MPTRPRASARPTAGDAGDAADFGAATVVFAACGAAACDARSPCAAAADARDDPDAPAVAVALEACDADADADADAAACGSLARPVTFERTLEAAGAIPPSTRHADTICFICRV